MGTTLEPPPGFMDEPPEGEVSFLPARQSQAAAFAEPARPNTLQAMSIEQQRAIAEIQTAMFVAKQYPREVNDVIRRIRTACARQSLAEVAEYSYPRGGEEVSGPSVYLMKAIAQEWGNIEYGIRELSREQGRSTVQTYAWDMERGAKQTLVFEVKHWRDTKKGGYAIKDERDIYELVANMGSRRLRACLEGVIPEDVKQIAIDECNRTMREMKLVTPETIAKMIAAFEKHGITKDRIEAKLGRMVSTMSPGQMVRLGKQYQAIVDGMITPDDAFPPVADPDAKPENTGAPKTSTNTAALRERMKGNASKPAAREPGEEG